MKRDKDMIRNRSGFGQLIFSDLGKISLDKVDKMAYIIASIGLGCGGERVPCQATSVTI